MRYKQLLNHHYKQITIGLAAVSVVLLVIAIYAIVNWQRSERQHDIALARQLTAQAQSVLVLEQSPQETAVLLAILSMRLSPSGEAAQIIQENTLEYPYTRMTWPTFRGYWEDFIYSICFSPN